ncbi:LysM peptidoglycan-binding domain-containing protein [Psychrobacter glaciei]|uniref:LysM peptidoglycan-binding domain-containing protein n=1 Tax=Psychrobacter glaciei TaxID=619771 RepID=UPI003F48F399
MSKPKSIIFQLRFVDLLNNPFPNLYHEIRESGTPISVSKSDSQGLGTPISRPPSTTLVVHIRHPLTKEMIKVKHHISVPAKEGKIILKAPFSIQAVKLRELAKIAGSYKRSTHKVTAGKDEYEVKKGQDLYTIAEMHNTTWQILAQLNKATIKDPDKIVPGQFIKVPPKGSSLTGKTNERPDSLTSQTHYEVKKGETLSGISQRSGVSVEELKRINGITDPTTLQVEQTIKLRGNGSAKPQTATKPSPTPTARPTPKQSSKPSSSDKEEGFFDGEMDTVTDIAKGTVGAIGGAIGSISDGLGTIGERLEAGSDAMSSGKNDKPAGGAPAAGTDSKTKTDTLIKIPVEQEYSSKDGTPKVVSGAVCKDDPACIFKGKNTDEAEKKLVLEVNIRLAGFGGALPSDDFTDLTEKCIKQFQRDYMKAPETGKICGSLIKAIDEFNYKYPIGLYHEQMKCPCGQCSGFGNGRMGVPSGRSIANEYPGMHRSIVWAFKACMFYLSFTKIGYKALLVSSGYRCIVRNVQKGRKSVNHMGQALDVQFSRVSNGAIANSVADVEKIREVILVKSMGAEYRWDKKNEISLETTADGASSWVHFDSREYEQKYKKLNFYAKTVAEMVGSDLSTHTDNKMLACGGTFITKNKTKNMKSIGGIIGKIIASHESQGGRYDIFNRGTIGEYAWTSGYENIEDRTIDEWRKLGTLSGDNKDKRFAMGKYQIIPDTLGEVQKSLKLLGSTKLTPEIQELMFLEHFVKKTNIITAIKSGSNKDIESATMKIAKIWASVGVPFATSRIAKKKAENGKLVSYTIDLKRGQSYWSGTGGNQAHTSPALAIKALKDMNNDYKTLISQGSSSEEAFDKVMSIDTKLF